MEFLHRDTIEVYQDRSRRWRWRYIGSGHILADGAQSYSRRIDAVNGARRVVGKRLRRIVTVQNIEGRRLPTPDLGERVTLGPETVVTGAPAEPWQPTTRRGD